MNLANRLIDFFSFSFRQNYEKEQLAKIQTVSVACAVMTFFFLMQSLVMFLSSSFFLGFVYFATAIFLSSALYFLSRNAYADILTHLIVIIPGIALIFFLIFDASAIIGIIAMCLFPILAVSTQGHSRGGIYSIVLGFIFIISLFLPFDFLENLYKLPLANKFAVILFFLAVLLVVYIYDFIKLGLIQSMEKQLLDQKNMLKLKEDFIANLSHQIRTPLNNIMVIANILENISNDEKQKDMIDSIHASTNNLVNVVNSMVEISNVDIKERGSINITFNLHSTINSTIKLFSTQSSNQTSFSLKVDESLPQSLIGDPVRIKQIFLNLIESILKNKSSSKAIVRIKVLKAKETAEEIELEIEVSSNKPIMLPLNEGHNLFITNESSLTSASTQMYIDLLELSITQKLIESNGGKLSIALSAEDAAFSFPYTLNKLIAKGEQPNITETTDTIISDTSDLQITPSVELENSNVLLVEDNLINQKIVVLSLKKLVKSIEIANNGKEALDKFGTSRFDIILMDIQMPIMNGIVATKKIREIETSSNSHTPIVAITANALLGDKEECLAAGMDDYISKPFQIEVLIQKMKKLLQSS